jgi:DNA replication protein DnaC
MQEVNEFLYKIKADMRIQESPSSSAASAESRGLQQFVGQCDQHGEYPLNFVGAQGIQRWRPDVCPACQRQAVVMRLVSTANIPDRHKHCEFDNYETDTHAGQQMALDVCRDYAVNFSDHYRAGRCLILRGNRGCGKNHLATAIAKTALAKGYSVLRLKAQAFLAGYWGKKFEERDAWIQGLANTDLLILDELGRHPETKGAEDAFFSLIDARSEMIRPSILLSNKTADEIKTILTLEGWDRLAENGGIFVNFVWDSFRLKSA